MVVEGIIKNGIYFTYDFPQIVIRNYNADLSVKIDIQGEVVYNEKMTSNRVLINDLGNLLSSYTSKPSRAIAGLYKIVPTDVTITLKDKTEEVIFPIQILFSRVKLTPPGRLNTFISRYKKIDTSLSRQEYVTFLYTENSSLKIRLEYKSEGKVLSSIRTIPYGRYDKNTLLNQDVSSNTITELFGVEGKDIIAYDVSLLYSDTVTDKIRYVVEGVRYVSSLTVTYANAVGAWETFAFNGTNIWDPEFSTQIYHVLTGAKQTSSNIKRYQSVNTGFLNKPKRQALEDLIISEEIFVEFDGSRKKIIIEEADMKYTEHNGEANSATVKFYPAESHDRELFRDVLVLEKIFDDTFDVTFN